MVELERTPRASALPTDNSVSRATHRAVGEPPIVKAANANVGQSSFGLAYVGVPALTIGGSPTGRWVARETELSVGNAEARGVRSNSTMVFSRSDVRCSSVLSSAAGLCS